MTRPLGIEATLLFKLLIGLRDPKEICLKVHSTRGKSRDLNYDWVAALGKS